ncbi:DUF262 domain-containing protein [Mycoplasmatota bacterium WC30]
MSFQTPITVAQVIEDIDNKNYLLPAIQREYVWDHSKIEWLFDSIMRDYPISSFLFWRVEGDTKSDYKFYSFLNEYRERYKTHNEEFNTSGVNDFKAVLDGQQRLTSLYIGLKGSYAYKKKNVRWDDSEKNIPTRHLYLNILEPLVEEEDGRIYEFKFLTREEYVINENKWFRVGKILELSSFIQFKRYLDKDKYKDNEFAQESLAILQNTIFNSRLINYFEEKDQNIDKALNIFIRVNSGGEPLNFSDLLMSIAIANWTKRDARKEIYKAIDEIRDLGYFIRKDLILKTFLFLYSKDIKFKVTNFSNENAKDFESKWDEIKLAILSVFKLIKSYGYTEKTLTSKNALIPIIYYVYYRNISDGFDSRKQYEIDRENIRKWLNLVLIKRIFGGQSDNVLSQIRRVFTKDITKSSIEENILEFPKQKIVQILRGTTSDLSMDEDYLDNILLTQKDNALAFSILALLYPNLDFKNDFHKDHIHPADNFKKTATLIKLGIDESKHQIYQNQELWNSILNLQLLDANENMSKQEKPLNEWVENEINKNKTDINKFCSDHVFPNILEFDKFEEFISIRRSMIKKKIRSVI